MSDLPFDPSTADAAGQASGQQPGQPSEEEVRQYLSQMRGAPVEQVLAEVLQGMLNAAQVKLGRRDARLLLDTASGVVEQTRPHLSGDLAKQVEEALSQLKLAQVQAEKEVAQAGADEPNDLTEGGRAEPSEPGDESVAGQQHQAGDPGQPGQPGQQGRPGGDSPLNKLWIPGR